MKKSILIKIFTVSIIFSSCSNEEVDVSQSLINQETSINSYEIKRYLIPNNILTDSVHFQIENNRIINASGINNITTNPITLLSNYIYTNNKLSEIITFQNGQQVRNSKYSYNTNGDLSELLIESLSSSNQQPLYSRHTFTHTQDTIYSLWEEATSDLNFDTLVASTKIVLDANNNRVYNEIINHRTTDSLITINTYDSNNNMLTDNNFRISRGVLTEKDLNTFTYTSDINPLAIINETTFERETQMLLYHLQASALNDFTPRIISPNLLNTFETTFFPDITKFEILNIKNGKNVINDFQTFANEELLFRFTTGFNVDQ